jgi:hypothetical protein
VDDQNRSNPSFFSRLGIAFACFSRALGSGEFATRVSSLLSTAALPTPAIPVKPAELPPERVHASGLIVLAMLQREGRLIDFLQEDVAAFSDEEVGATARVVHSGCRKVLGQCLTLEPMLKDAEGASVSVPAGFDAQRIRLTGNLAGQPPFRGSLKHHGWVATAVRFPATSESLDPRVLAPAEVDL